MADWQVGDLALCVSIKPHWSDQAISAPFVPKVGGLYTVARCGLCRFGHNLLLGLREDPNGLKHGYLAFRFVKVTPPEADAFDREVIDLMTGAPQEVG